MNKRKKVAILGFTPTRRLAPYDDKDFEIWGLNDLYKFKGDDDIKRWDRWFDIHDTTKDYRLLGRMSWQESFKEFATWKCPIYMQKHHPEIPASVAYPVGEVVNRFGRYFTNSISYMIGLAILEEFEEIHVYGVDMAVDSEYNYERPSCEYILGVAVGRGIKIYIPPQADLLKSRCLYGFDDVHEECYRQKLGAMRASMEASKSSAEAEAERVKKIVWQYDGAIEAIREADKAWKSIIGEVPDIKVGE